MHFIYIVDLCYPKRMRSHLFISKLGPVKINKNESGESENRSQRFRIMEFILISARPKQVDIHDVRCWTSKGAETVTKWSSQSSAAAMMASPL